MGLIPKVLLTALSANASSLYVQEITGNYSAENPGGYGAPNVDKVDIQGIMLRLYHEGNEANVISYRPVNYLDYLAGNSQLVRVTDFGVEGTLSDGVIHAQYYALLAVATVESIGGDQLSITSAAQFRSNEAVVVANNVVYRVDPAANNTPSILYLLDPIPLGTTTVEGGYVGTSHILNARHVESDMAKAIGNFAGRCGCNDKQVMDLTKGLLKLLGAPVRYACGDLKGANTILITLSNDLRKGDCGC